LGLSLALLACLALALAALIWRIRSREAAIRRRYPPLGVLVPVEGGLVHALMMGTGPDLVLIHGASGQLRDLEPLMQRLAPRFRVTAFDRPGLGYSTGLGEGGVSPAAQALHLARAAAQLGIKRPIVLGQSYGGTVALAWGLEVQGEQSAAALVLVSAPSLPWPGKLDWWYRLTETSVGRALGASLATALVTDAYLDSVMPGLFAPNPPPPGYARATGAALAMPRRTMAANALQVNGLYAHVTAMQARYPDLHLPVELVHGVADQIVPAAIHSQPLAALLPNAHLTLLPGSGHMPHHTDPEAVIAAITRAAHRAGWTWDLPSS
jgi:pimeloyl-ACP methyl ester carboxylesterase